MAVFYFCDYFESCSLLSKYLKIDSIEVYDVISCFVCPGRIDSIFSVRSPHFYRRIDLSRLDKALYQCNKNIFFCVSPESYNVFPLIGHITFSN